MNSELTREWRKWHNISVYETGRPPYYDELRAGDTGHDDALRRVASRLTGILHGCVKHRREYDEAVAWNHRTGLRQAA